MLRFESMRANRIKTIEALENCEQQLCKNLGCTPKGLMCFPLPSQKLILSFENYLEDMEKEKFIRRERLCKKKEEIIQIVKKLGIQPFMDFEKTVIEGDDSMFLVTDDNMEKLEHLHQSLKQQLSDSEEEAENLSKKVEKLWNVLEVDEQERDLFRNKCVGTVFQKIALLKEELKRCDLLKCKNIQVGICVNFFIYFIRCSRLVDYRKIKRATTPLLGQNAVYRRTKGFISIFKYKCLHRRFT